MEKESTRPLKFAQHIKNVPSQIVVLLILVLMGGVLAPVMLRPKHPSMLTWQQWLLVEPESLFRLSIRPVCGADVAEVTTLDRTIVVTDQQTMRHIWEELHGQRNMSQCFVARNRPMWDEFWSPDKWSNGPYVKLVWELHNRKRYLFCINFHSEYPIAHYTMFSKDSDSVFRHNTSGDLASEKLYQLLEPIIRDSGAAWKVCGSSLPSAMLENAKTVPEKQIGNE